MGSEHQNELIGTTLDGRYAVVSLLGEGAMGVVYRARHVTLGSEVALKVLRRSVMHVPGIVERAVREAQTASAIGDPHIVDVRDFGVTPGGAPYMVMELLDGTELTELIEAEAPLPVERAVHIAIQVAQALGAAHATGVVHRDLKAENVLLVARPDNPDFVKLVDFGIAHVTNAESKITKAGELLGTPQYMSPEQCWGQPVDHRTDVYALGVLLYEMLTGLPPFTEREPHALLIAHMTSSAAPLRDHRPELPAALDALVLRCLAKRPDQRFESMATLVQALQRATSPRRPEGTASTGAGTSVDAAFGTRDTVPLEAVAPLPEPLVTSVTTSTLEAAPVSSSRGPRRFLRGVLLGLASLVALAAGGAGALGLVAVCAHAEAREVPGLDSRPMEASSLDGTPLEAGAIGALEASPLESDAVRAPTEPDAPAPVELGSAPSGAEVFDADGVFIGNTPMRVLRPQDGSTRYRLVLRGFVSRDVEVGPSTQDTVVLSLAPAGARARTGRR